MLYWSNKKLNSFFHFHNNNIDHELNKFWRMKFYFQVLSLKECSKSWVRIIVNSISIKWNNHCPLSEDKTSYYFVQITASLVFWGGLIIIVYFIWKVKIFSIIPVYRVPTFLSCSAMLLIHETTFVWKVKLYSNYEKFKKMIFILNSKKFYS